MNYITNSSLFVVLVLLGAATSLSGDGLSGNGQPKGEDMSGKLSEREELHQQYQLSQGASVEVSNFPFGGIIIEPTDAATAEVHIVRTARTRDELACNHFVVEQTAAGLRLRGNENGNCHLQNTSIEQNVLLKIPRYANISASSISGPLRVGEAEGRGPNFVQGPNGEKVAQPADRPFVTGKGFDGAVRVQSISGPVRIVQGSGETNISGVSGPVSITFRRFGQRSVSVDGINSSVELRFLKDLNAELKLNDIRGEIRGLGSSLRLDHTGKNSFRAQLGAGGSPISISSINGDVVLRRE
jgi:hypothetical protein